MNKLILIASFMLILCRISYSQPELRKTVRDGLYLITKIDTVAAQFSSLSSNEIAISFSQLFKEYDKHEFIRIIIDTTEYVPLELEKMPTTEQQNDLYKKLMLSLTKMASEKLQMFTTTHVMSRVVLVVDGEALTIHKIRGPITGGQLQITRCTDNACERLFVKLKDNIKK
jgi:preprotein translocase subunit SecD